MGEVGEFDENYELGELDEIVKLVTFNIYILELLGPRASGPRLLIGGPLGLIDFILCTLWVLRLCDPCNNAGIG